MRSDETRPIDTAPREEQLRLFLFCPSEGWLAGEWLDGRWVEIRHRFERRSCRRSMAVTSELQSREPPPSIISSAKGATAASSKGSWAITLCHHDQDIMAQRRAAVV
jgi:hypothetical protein